jgi:hypothetical protein
LDAAIWARFSGSDMSPYQNALTQTRKKFTSDYPDGTTFSSFCQQNVDKKVLGSSLPIWQDYNKALMGFPMLQGGSWFCEVKGMSVRVVPLCLLHLYWYMMISDGTWWWTFDISPVYT